MTRITIVTDTDTITLRDDYRWKHHIHAIKKNGITDATSYFQPFVDDYNRRAVPYKKIGLLRVREEPFPKNTLRKIMRFKLDMSID